MLRPAALTHKGFVPPVILPGSNHAVLQQGIEGFLETRACFRRFAFADADAYRVEEGRNPERLQGVPCVPCSAIDNSDTAPVVSPRFADRGHSAALWRAGLSDGQGQREMRKNFSRTENKPLHVHEAIRPRAAEEIGNGKDPALDVQLGRGFAPATPEANTYVLIDLQRGQMEPEVLDTRDGLEHCRPLFGFIAAAAPEPTALGL